jgi:hypothetical protein
MHERRYQVFLSSTFEDLREERQRVIQTLLQMDCIPIGMELFPAADEEQWKFIQRVIDDCDYYVLLLGDRYGSLAADGMSYTEKEFDYAVSKTIPVIAFLRSPDRGPSTSGGSHGGVCDRLVRFREKVCADRLVKTWQSPEELPGLVAISVSKAIKAYPAKGWVRGGSPDSFELLNELNELRKRNEELTESLKARAVQRPEPLPDLAAGEDTFELCGYYKLRGYSNRFDWREPLSWNRILYLIGPDLLGQWKNEAATNHDLAETILKGRGKEDIELARIDDQPFHTLKIQLLALGYIETKSLQTNARSMAMFWTLTGRGRQLLLVLRTRRKEGTERTSGAS